ncbi:hypothetical protein ABH931_001632 [Streptacidiphilus sp. MAP12-33]|uniref:hypothetical protein n=1 Tax=Streptacidiphilus sp. MAP12-33 TaxID=3156266 RepID=UPI003518673F
MNAFDAGERRMWADRAERPVCRMLRWDHRAPAEERWSGAAAGLGSVGVLLQGRPEAVRAEAKRHFDPPAQEFLGADGPLVLPHAALPAGARR